MTHPTAARRLPAEQALPIRSRIRNPRRTGTILSLLLAATAVASTIVAIGTALGFRSAPIERPVPASAAAAPISDLPSAAGNAPQPAGETFYDGSVTSADGTRIVFTVFIPALKPGEQAPLIIHGHGFGLSRTTNLDSQSAQDQLTAGDPTREAARRAWHDGFIVISFDQRGFGQSGGEVNVMDPNLEGKDVSAIIDWAAANLRTSLATRNGDPLVGALGLSYGGGFQTIGAAVDPRFDAIVPAATWNDLRYSLYPNGVVKSLWVDTLVAAGGPGAKFRFAPFIYQAFVEALTSGRIDAAIIDRFRSHSLASFCAGDRADGRRAPKVDAFFVQGVHDVLFNMNEAVRNADCLRATGADVRLLVQRDGHIMPLLQQAGPQILFGMEKEVQCGSERYETAQLMLDFLKEKLKGIRPARPAPAVCITQGPGSGIVAARVAVGGPEFAAAPVSLTTGVAPELLLGALRQSPQGALTDALAKLPANGQALVAAILAGTRQPNDLVRALQPAFNLLPPEVLASLTTAPRFVPLQVNRSGGKLAGIPLAKLDLASMANPAVGSNAAVSLLGISLNLGAALGLDARQADLDPIVFVGLGRQPAGGGPLELINDQLTPLRGAGHYAQELAGVSIDLNPGDTIGLVVYSFHPQYATSFSKLPSPVTVSGTVQLPLR